MPLTTCRSKIGLLSLLIFFFAPYTLERDSTGPDERHTISKMTSTKVEVQEANGPQVEEIASYSYTIHEDEYSSKPQNGMLIEEFSESEDNGKKNGKVENLLINRGISIVSISDDDASPKGLSRDVSNDEIQSGEEFINESYEAATKKALYSETIVEEKSIADDSSVAESVVVKETTQSAYEEKLDSETGIKQNAVIEESSFSRQTSVEQVSVSSPTVENVTLPLKAQKGTLKSDNKDGMVIENVSKNTSQEVSLEFRDASNPDKQNGLYNQTTEQSSDHYVTQDGNLTQEITINKKVITEEFIVEDGDELLNGNQWIAGEANVSHEVSKRKASIDGGYEEISTIKMQSSSQQVFLQEEDVSHPGKQKAILAEDDESREVTQRKSNGKVEDEEIKSRETVVEKQKESHKVTRQEEEIVHTEKQNGVLEEKQTNGEEVSSRRTSRQSSINDGSLTKSNIVKRQSISEEEASKAEEVTLPLRRQKGTLEERDSITEDDSARRQSLTKEKIDLRRESIAEEQVNGKLSSQSSSRRSSVRKDASEDKELVDDVLSRKYSRHNSERSSSLSKQNSLDKARIEESEDKGSTYSRQNSLNKAKIEESKDKGSTYSRRNSEKSNNSLSKQNSILERLDSTESRKSLKRESLEEVKNATLSDNRKVEDADVVDGTSTKTYSRQYSEKSNRQNSVLERLDSTESRKDRSRSGSILERLDSTESRKSRNGSIIERLDSQEGRRSISSQNSRERAKVNDDNEEEEDEDMKRLFERIKRQRSVLDEILEKQEKSSEITNEGKSKERESTNVYFEIEKKK